MIHIRWKFQVVFSPDVSDDIHINLSMDYNLPNTAYMIFLRLRRIRENMGLVSFTILTISSSSISPIFSSQNMKLDEKKRIR